MPLKECVYRSTVNNYICTYIYIYIYHIYIYTIYIYNIYLNLVYIYNVHVCIFLMYVYIYRYHWLFLYIYIYNSIFIFSALTSATASPIQGVDERQPEKFHQVKQALIRSQHISSQYYLLLKYRRAGFNSPEISNQTWLEKKKAHLIRWFLLKNLPPVMRVSQCLITGG